MKPIEFSIAIVAVSAIFVGWLYAGQWIIQYEITKEALRVKLFGVITLRRIKLQDIEEVQLISVWTDTLPLSKNFSLNSLWQNVGQAMFFRKKVWSFERKQD